LRASGPRRVPIRLVLASCILSVAALTIAFLAVQRYEWVTGTLLRDELNADLDLARSVAAGLDRYMAGRLRLIEALARELGAGGGLEGPPLDSWLARARTLDPAFRALTVVDTTGVGRAGSAAGLRLDDREWFRRAITGSGQPSFEVVISRTVGLPTVAVAAPVRLPTGRLIGVLVGGLDLAEMRQSVREALPGFRDRLVVVDARGRILSHWSPEWEAEARDLSSESVFQAAQHQSEGIVEYLSLFTNQTKWGAYVKVPLTGWVVWASRGPELSAARLRSLLRDLAFASLAAIILAGVAAVAVSALLSRPLGQLVEAARDVAARRFEAGTLLLRRRSRIREFDDLLTGFRDMAEHLQTQYENLEARVAERTRELEHSTREAETAAALLRIQEEIRRGYGELAALLNSLDRSHILEEATKKIAASLHAPLAAVYLTEDGSGDLRLKTYSGVDAGLVDAALLGAAGFPAEVARQRVAVVVSLPHHGERLVLRTGMGTIPVAAVAGFPLMYQDRLVGVLMVALLEAITDIMRSFLEDAARQLSVALNNAGLFESVRYQSQQLEQLNTELKRASEIKSEFLASMSHELRTPLNSIIGFTELLLSSAKEPLTERQRTSLDKVLKSGKHLLSLINDVLDLSKIEAGQMEVRAESVALGPLIRQCLEVVEPQAQAKGLRLQGVGLETAPTVVQDRRKVEQILLNLLSNAVKFTASGSVDVRIGPPHEGAVTVSVADTGIGLRAEHFEEIFEAFHQVDASETRAAGGTGLGLPISRRLADLMGGSLTVESAQGQGSVFTLRLPLRYADGQEASDIGRSLRAGARARRVLVIDDDQDTVDLIRHALAEEGFAVEWAANAAAGLRHVRTRPPTLILLDIILQGHHDGWDLLASLKGDPATHDIPVVIHSVIDNPQRARQLEADGVLVKPASADTLRVLLHRLLPSDSSTPEETAPA